MSCKSLKLVVSLAIIPLLFFGCGEKSPKDKAEKSPARQKIAAPSLAKKAKEKVQKNGAKVKKEAFAYNAAGKRDPFQALVNVKKSISSTLGETTPLQKFALNQLRVIGVIWGKGEPHAMVVAPDGKSYVLKKGTKVGKNNGTVIEISQKVIVVEEQFFDFTGTVKVSKHEISLPKQEGVK